MNAKEAKRISEAWDKWMNAYPMEQGPAPCVGETAIEAEIVLEVVEATAPLLAQYVKMREALEEFIGAIKTDRHVTNEWFCYKKGTDALKDAQAIEDAYRKGTLGE